MSARAPQRRRGAGLVRGWTLAGVVALAGLVELARADAPAPSPEDLAKIQASLERGAFSDAIAELELWSDRGVVHPDLSFDRGVAYLGRAESPAKRRADLGQAVAAFEEALQLAPGDEEAAIILGRIRAELDAGRDKRASAGVVARPRLSRALLELVGEDVWAGLGALGSLVLSLGLVARLASSQHRARLGGGIAAVVGLVVAALGATMAYVGHHLRMTTSPAVVIVEQARLQGADGRPIAAARGASTLGESADRVPEGTLVHISATRGGLVQIEWGDGEAWLDARDVRRIAPSATTGSGGTARTARVER